VAASGIGTVAGMCSKEGLDVLGPGPMGYHALHACGAGVLALRLRGAPGALGTHLLSGFVLWARITCSTGSCCASSGSCAGDISSCWSRVLPPFGAVVSSLGPRENHAK
jgi:hypothetical protein